MAKRKKTKSVLKERMAELFGASPKKQPAPELRAKWLSPLSLEYTVLDHRSAPPYEHKQVVEFKEPGTYPVEFTVERKGFEPLAIRQDVVVKGEKTQ